MNLLAAMMSLFVGVPESQSLDSSEYSISDESLEGEDYCKLSERQECIEDWAYDEDLHGLGTPTPVEYMIWPNEDEYDDDDESNDSPSCIFFTASSFDDLGDFDVNMDTDDVVADITSLDEIFQTPNEVHEVSESDWSFDSRLETMKENLKESMRRSQQTRQSLAMETNGVPFRQRWRRLSDAIQSVQESASRLQTDFD